MCCFRIISPNINNVGKEYSIRLTVGSKFGHRAKVKCLLLFLLFAEFCLSISWEYNIPYNRLHRFGNKSKHEIWMGTSDAVWYSGCTWLHFWMSSSRHKVQMGNKNFIELGKFAYKHPKIIIIMWTRATTEITVLGGDFSLIHIALQKVLRILL